MASITLEIEVPEGVNADVLRRECTAVIDRLRNEAKHQLTRHAEMEKVFESDAALEQWTVRQWPLPDMRPAVGRACWYDYVATCQEVCDAIYWYNNRTPRRPVIMRGSIEHLKHKWRSDSYRARVIERYLRITRYTCTAPRSIIKHIRKLDFRLRDHNARGWRLWLQSGPGSRRDVTFGSDGRRLLPEYWQGQLLSSGVWVDGKLVSTDEYCSGQKVMQDGQRKRTRRGIGARGHIDVAS